MSSTIGDAGGFRPNVGTDEPPPGIDHSISPWVPCPETVLVAPMNDGSYLLMGYAQGEPVAFVKGDAGLPRQELTEAFGNSVEGAANANGNGKRTGVVLPERKASCPRQTRP